MCPKDNNTLNMSSSSALSLEEKEHFLTHGWVK